VLERFIARIPTLLLLGLVALGFLVAVSGADPFGGMLATLPAVALLVAYLRAGRRARRGRAA
jgi:hypothetical protein